MMVPTASTCEESVVAMIRPTQPKIIPVNQEGKYVLTVVTKALALSISGRLDFAIRPVVAVKKPMGRETKAPTITPIWARLSSLAAKTGWIAACIVTKAARVVMNQPITVIHGMVVMEK